MHQLKSHRPRAVRPPDRYGRARVVRDSPSDVVDASLWCGDAPVIQPPGDRGERRTREPHPGSTTASQPRRHHQKRATRPVAGLRSVWGRSVSTVPSTDSFTNATKRHNLYVFAVFDMPFPRQDGPPERKCHLESGLNQRGRAKSAVSPIKSFVKTTKSFRFVGCLLCYRPPRTRTGACPAARGAGCQGSKKYRHVHGTHIVMMANYTKRHMAHNGQSPVSQVLLKIYTVCGYMDHYANKRVITVS